MYNKVSRSKLGLCGHFKPALVKVLSLGKLIMGGHFKSWLFQSFSGLIFMGLLIFFSLAIGSGYFYMSPAIIPSINHDNGYGKADNFTGQCNVFDGRWVADEGYPLYNASECPFAEKGFNCLANGRKDKAYLKWRWKPKNCDVPRFDVRVILENLRGKRIVFVGDSLSRTQWESMICMLMSGVEDKKSVYEVNGNKITKQIRYLAVRFSSFDFTIEFYRSVFLVQPAAVPKRAPKRVKSSLKLDKLDNISNEWTDADVLIFNTGHWWTPTKLFDMGCYFQVGGRMRLGMSTVDAFRTALTTWKSWVERMVNPSKTRIFIRTFESTHWSSGNRQNCKVTRQPSTTPKGRDRSPFSSIIFDVVKNLRVPVTVLHVTPMGAFRSDGHVGTWSDNPLVPDCSHWCLPGVPDAWNELLFWFLFAQERDSTP